MTLLIYLLIFTSWVKKDGRTEDEKSLGEGFKNLYVRNHETYKIVSEIIQSDRYRRHFGETAMEVHF